MVKKKVLVIGYGAIGERHANILHSMETVGDVFVLSGRQNLPFPSIRSMEEIQTLDPDYIVVASKTSSHFDQLKFIIEKLKNKTVLVEKPLFDAPHRLPPGTHSIFVAYNLRFHPVIQLIKKKTMGRKIWSLNVFCGSFLPEWRPGRDYRATYSASRTTGGGVLLDLSHELDYVQWIAGKIMPQFVLLGKVSDLHIDSDDLLMLSGKTDRGAAVQLTLNYFSRKPMRQIVLDGEDISIQADLIGNTITVHERGEKSEFSWPDLQRNSTYQAEHETILVGNATDACRYEEGADLMNLIEKIGNWGN